MKHIFIINPTAGKKNNVKEITKIVEKHTECDTEIYVTKGKLDGRGYVKKVCEKNPGEKLRFYACGGDGTTNEVLNGCFGYGNAEMASYACGSGNDFVKAFPGRNFRDLEALIKGEVQVIDTLRVNGEYCANVCNCGFDAGVAHNMSKFKKWPFVGGKGAYNLSLLYSILHERKHRAKIYADGDLINEQGFVLATCANGVCCGGSFYCAPNAHTDDGIFKLIVVKPVKLMKFISLVKYYRKGNFEESAEAMKYVTLRQCRNVRIESEKKIKYVLDGETHVNENIEVDILPLSMKIVIPALTKKD